MAAAMVLGANIGTTIDAIMAALGAKTGAKRTALVHVLFNVLGALIALIFFRPLIAFVDLLTPGGGQGIGIASRIAMFHTVFNVMCTLIFLPFTRKLAALVSFLIKDKPEEAAKSAAPYRFAYQFSTRNTPELNIIRGEKELCDMAGLASGMFGSVVEAMRNLREAENREALVDKLVNDCRAGEGRADEMREELTSFLFECTRQQISKKSEQRVFRLLRMIADLEDMTDDCYALSLLLERSVKKSRVFKGKEMQALAPYVSKVENFLNFVQAHIGQSLNPEEAKFADELEDTIDKSRKKLRKMGRKRIEAGQDVKTELLFIDVVRRVEKVADYCYNIAETLAGGFFT
jgi:phosphate:Na+ symporter